MVSERHSARAELDRSQHLKLAPRKTNRVQECHILLVRQWPREDSRPPQNPERSISQARTPFRDAADIVFIQVHHLGNDPSHRIHSSRHDDSQTLKISGPPHDCVYAFKFTTILQNPLQRCPLQRPKDCCAELSPIWLKPLQPELIQFGFPGT